jgi:sigma-B regulation protein RsbU (phosphoserine phosphatase)
MPKTTVEELRARVAELEQEVREREADLKRFRLELGTANTRLESLIGRLQGEFKLAHAIQKALVPTEFPNINGFEFSTKFIPSLKQGGDYFDIFEHQDRLRFGVILSSSSGHSMSALLLNVLLKMTGQIESRRGSEPHQVLHDMFDELREHLGESDDSDIFYSLIDRRTYEMRYVLAGEVTALHQSATTNEITALGPAVGPLSRGFDGPDASVTLALNPRDRMVICSRGLTASPNAAGEAFGVERVTRALLEGPRHGVHELRNYLLHEVERFVDSTEATPRDLTVVVLEVKDKDIKLARS